MKVLNHIPILNFLGNATGTAAHKGAALGANALADAALFKGQLDSSLLALFAKNAPSGDVAAPATVASTTASTPSAAKPAATDELEQHINAQLDKGTSLDAVIEQLAGSLATQVAAQLGVPVETAQAKLTAAFTQALAPPGSGPPQTNAERASTLATRFRQIAELATRVTNDAGQPIRSIAGTSLDAVTTAGANPAPQSSTPASPDRAVTASVPAAAATPASQPSLPAQTPKPPQTPQTALPVTTAATVVTQPSTAPAGDGLVVPIAPAQAVASGGDTLLGRMLARATLAETSANTPDVQPAPVAPALASSASPHANADPNPSNHNDAATTTTTTANASANVKATAAAPALDAFLNAFSVALAQKDAPSAPAFVAEQAKDDTAPLPAVSSTSSTPSSPVLAFAIPVASDNATAIAPPAPVSTLPQAQPVDPQAVIDQIVRGMSINTGDGQSTVKLRLVPENLGDVSVKLTVSGGTVTASITAHSVDAQNAIVAGQPQLARTLADAGLKLQSFTVGLAGNGSAGPNSDQKQQQNGSRSNASRRIGALADESGDTDELDLLAAPSFGPPIYTASRGLGALNYLV